MRAPVEGFDISSELRRRWLEASGAKTLQQRADSAGNLTFKELVLTASAKLAPEERASIAKDVGRSQVAGSAAYALFDDDAFRAQHSARIRDVLVIFVADRADWGYCQGFNFVASALLLLLRGDVEAAAWLLDALYSRFFISSFFARQPKMSGFHTEVEVLAILVAQTFPCIDDALDDGELEMTAQLLGFRWFVPCWTTELKPQVLVAVLDWLLGTARSDEQCCLLNLRLALALFQLFEQSLIDEMERTGSSISAYQHMTRVASELEDGQLLVAAAQRVRLDPARVAQLRFSSEASAEHRDEEVSSLSTLTHFSVGQLTALRAQFEEIADDAAGTASARISSKTLQEVLARTTPEWPAACTNRLVDILTATSAAGLGLGGETPAKPPAHAVGLGSGAGELHRRAMSPLMRRNDGTEGTEAGIDFRTLMCAISVLRNGRVEERLRLVFRLFARTASSSASGDLGGAAAFTVTDHTCGATGDSPASGAGSDASGDAGRYLDLDGMFALAKTLHLFLPKNDPLFASKATERVHATFNGVGAAAGGKSLRTRANEAHRMRGGLSMEMTPNSFVGASLLEGRVRRAHGRKRRSASMTHVDSVKSASANVFVAKLLQMATAESARGSGAAATAVRETPSWAAEGGEGKVAVRLSCERWVACALTSPDILRCFEINAPMSPLEKMSRTGERGAVGKERTPTSRGSAVGAYRSAGKRLFADPLASTATRRLPFDASEYYGSEYGAEYGTEDDRFSDGDMRSPVFSMLDPNRAQRGGTSLHAAHHRAVDSSTSLLSSSALSVQKHARGRCCVVGAVAVLVLALAGAAVLVGAGTFYLVYTHAY